MTHIPVSPFFPPLHNFSPPPLFLSFFFLFLSFFFFIKPPCAICSRLRRHEKQQPAVTLRYYVAVQTAQWQTSACYPALSLCNHPRALPAALTRGGEGLCFYARTQTSTIRSYARRLCVPRQYGRSYVMPGVTGVCGAADSPGVARTPL